jgi:oxygen-dependent protoporphyrinogen oxidase
MSVRTLVVGDGVTGLALGFALRARGADATVLEAAPRAGGHVRTVEEDGFRVEAGPNGFLSREPATLELAAALGLEPLEARPEAKRRYIVRGGRLCVVPSGPPGLLMSPALSPAGRLRLALEPFARRAPEGVEETVHAFAARRIGGEAADMLVDAAVAGISAGDSRALSVDAAFPLMREMEREHGSLVRAMVARARAGRIARILSFADGLEAMTAALAARLGPALRTDARVVTLERRGATWRATLEHGSALEAENVVLAAPSHAVAPVVEPLDPALAAGLAGLPFAGVAVVALAYPVAAVPRRLDGYGYLVTRGEGMGTLGVLWDSTLFAGPAPEGMALLRAVLGGSRGPDVVGRAERTLEAAARNELERVMGVTAAPARAWTFRRPRAIAQYTLGHLERVARLRALAARHPGLELVGTSYDGVSFNHAVASALALAARLAGPAANGTTSGGTVPPASWNGAVARRVAVR